jgi:outer membrane protein OmpA-like peptidoglycan-associated protein
VAITQVGYGTTARYVFCALPDCRQPTPKSIAEPPPPPPPRAMPAPVAAPVPPAPPAVRHERLIVTFALGSAGLDARARRQLEREAGLVKQAQHVRVTGYTDASGNAAANERLSKRRARAVYEHLRRIVRTEPSRFTVDGKGGCCQVERNDTLAGRAANRRVEVELTLPAVAEVTVRPGADPLLSSRPFPGDTR